MVEDHRILISLSFLKSIHIELTHEALELGMPEKVGEQSRFQKEGVVDGKAFPTIIPYYDMAKFRVLH